MAGKHHAGTQIHGHLTSLNTARCKHLLQLEPLLMQSLMPKFPLTDRTSRFNVSYHGTTSVCKEPPAQAKPNVIHPGATPKTLQITGDMGVVGEGKPLLRTVCPSTILSSISGA